MNDLARTGEAVQASAKRLFRRSLHILPFNAGSCNGCELEIAALVGPLYALRRYGIDLVAAPSQADLLLVTGPITRQLLPYLARAYEAMPAPKLVAAMGACACPGGVFYGGYSVAGPLDRHMQVDLYVPGCPPGPQAILHGLLVLLGRAEQLAGRGQSSADGNLP